MKVALYIKRLKYIYIKKKRKKAKEGKKKENE
jgi:hypothetical protein